MLNGRIGFGRVFSAKNVSVRGKICGGIFSVFED
jgi:hypothetical protein